MTSDPDVAQKEWLAGVFDRAAPSYDRIGDAYHDHFGARLAETAGIHPEASVLDVACGRGAVLLPAAVRAGAGGLPVGVDLSPEMIRTAGEALACVLTPAATTELQVMDAERLEFDEDSFDFVLCSFGLFFFPRPTRATAEFLRVLVPGGVVAVSSWTGEDERWDWEDDLLADLDVIHVVPSRVPSTASRTSNSCSSMPASSMSPVTSSSVTSTSPPRTSGGTGCGPSASVAFSNNSTLHPSRPSSRPSSRQMQALREPAGFPMRLTAALVSGRKAAAVPVLHPIGLVFELFEAELRGAGAANVAVVDEAVYSALEDEARSRSMRDPSDWPLVACALALDAAVWTNDNDLLGTGVPTWTTETLPAAGLIEVPAGRPRRWGSDTDQLLDGGGSAQASSICCTSSAGGTPRPVSSAAARVTPSSAAVTSCCRLRWSSWSVGERDAGASSVVRAPRMRSPARRALVPAMATRPARSRHPYS